MWTQNVRPTSFGWLAWQITIDHCIDPAEGVEPVRELNFCSSVNLDIIIKAKKEAMEEARKDKPAWYFGRMDQNLIKVKPQLQFVGKINQLLDGNKKVYSWAETRRYLTRSYGQF